MTLGKAIAAIPTVSVTDLEEGKRFYEGTLGLEHMKDMPGQALYKCGNTYLCLHERPEVPRSSATVAAFEVEDVQAHVAWLRDNGVAFQDVDMPEMGIRTENGIARMEGLEAAWFTDPWGNILAIDNTVSKVGVPMAAAR